jgi:hypothetical protein
MKVCRPTFHDKYLSGGDEINMRWEFCTKMSFSKLGNAEWHSMASYLYPNMFEKYFQNYLLESQTTDAEQININRHLLTLDLAIYDEVQWQKIMHDNEVK